MTKKLKVNGLRSKMLLCFMSLIILICLGSSLISSYISNNALLETNGTYLPQIAKQASLSVSNSIISELKVLETIAENEKIKSEDVKREEKLNILKSEVKRTGSIAFTLIDKEGNAIDTKGREFNVKDKEHFKRCSGGEAIVSDPVRSENGNVMVVLYDVPIKKDGKVVGVLSSVKDENDLSGHIGEIKFGQSGRAYVLDKLGNVIAHQNKQLVLKQDNTIKESEQDGTLKELANIEKKMISGENGYGKYSYEGKEKYIGYAPIKNTEWSIAIVVEKEEMMKNVNTLKRGIVMASWILIALIVIIALIIVANMIKPIKPSCECGKSFEYENMMLESYNYVLNKIDDVGKN